MHDGKKCKKVSVSDASRGFSKNGLEEVHYFKNPRPAVSILISDVPRETGRSALFQNHRHPAVSNLNAGVPQEAGRRCVISRPPAPCCLIFEFGCPSMQ
jgi:hypothetical protein